jgi:uncharacterized protein YhbP (UPF0306 family)
MRIPSWIIALLKKIDSSCHKVAPHYNESNPNEALRKLCFKIKFIHPDLDSTRLGLSIAKILKDTHLCSMATSGKDGSCHINTAFFCFNEALSIFFVSDPATQHCKNLLGTSSMAMTVFDSHQPWGSSLRGLQLFGQCFQASDAEEKQASELYKKRFPLYAGYLVTLSPQERETLSFRFFAFRPDAVKILDEDEFGEETFVLTAIDRCI